MWRKGNICALLVEMQIGSATMENRMEVPQKIRRLTQDSAIPLLGIYPKEMKKDPEDKSALSCSLKYYSQ